MQTIVIVIIIKHLYTRLLQTVAAWLSANVVGCVNEVALRPARLVLRWATVRLDV